MPDSLEDWLFTVNETIAHGDDRSRIGAVFIASACEAMLREIIGIVLQKQGISDNLISYVLENARGRDALCKLYDVVAKTPMKDVLREAKLTSWFTAWGRLAQARNKYAHGKQFSEDLSDETIHVVECDMAAAFISLRNAALPSKAVLPKIGSERL